MNEAKPEETDKRQALLLEELSLETIACPEAVVFTQASVLKAGTFIHAALARLA
jgi:hypothetical protein